MSSFDIFWVLLFLPHKKQEKRIWKPVFIDVMRDVEITKYLNAGSVIETQVLPKPSCIAIKRPSYTV